MKYSVKQKVLSLRNQYEIRDEEGNFVYYVRSTFTIPYKLNFYNEQKELVMQIRKRYFRLLKRYDIKKDKEILAMLKQKFAIFKKNFKVISNLERLENVEIQGDIIGLSFQFTANGELVASVSKKILTVGDRYVVDVVDEKNKDIYLALAIALDDIVHGFNKKSRNVN